MHHACTFSMEHMTRSTQRLGGCILFSAWTPGVHPACTFLMEHMTTSTQRLGGCILLFSKSTHGTVCHKKEGGGAPRII